MSEMRAFLAAWLEATFSHVDGDLSVTDFALGVPASLITSDLDEIVAYCRDAEGHVYISTNTSDACAGIVMAFNDRERAQEAASALDPSYVVEEDGKAVYLVYLIEGLSLTDANLLLEDLCDEDDPGFFADITLPLPYGDFLLAEEDEAAMADGFAVYPVSAFVSAFFAEEAVEEQAKSAPAPAETTAPVSVSKIKDAEIIGDLTDDILKAQIQVSIGADQNSKNFKTFPACDYGVFLQTFLVEHKAGQKDGQCFVTGALAGKRRNKNDVTSLFMMGLDCDSGNKIEEVVETIQRLGLHAVLYTTHSHGVSQIVMKKDRFIKWAEKNGHDTTVTTEAIRAFLIDEDKYQKRIIDQVEYRETAHIEGGVQLIIDTPPIDKFRIVFLLEKPFVIAEQTMAQAEAILLWERKILGLGDMLGVKVDRSARDPSRLFFLPRHKKGAKNQRIVILGGKKLPFEIIPEGDLRGGPKVESDDPFEQAGAVLAGRLRGRAMSPTLGLDLRSWAASRGDGFMIHKVFEDHCDDRIRVRQTDSKFTCECPFDENHSNAGDPEDPGCYIEGAGDAEQFSFRCRHDSCAGHDRLTMLEKAMNEGWFPDSVLNDPSYDCISRDDEEQAEPEEGAPAEDEDAKVTDRSAQPKRFEKALRLSKAATKDTTPEEIEEIIELTHDFSEIQRTSILKILAKETGNDRDILRKQMREASRNSTASVNDKEFDAEGMATSFEKRFASLKSYKGRVIAVSMDDEMATVDFTIRRLNHLNERDPELFLYGDNKVRVSEDPQATFKPEAIRAPVMKSILSNKLAIVDKNSTSRAPRMAAPDWLSTLVTEDPRVDYKVLEGWATQFYFGSDGRLVFAPGYNPFTKRILKLDGDLKLEDTGYKPKPTMDDIDAAYEAFLGQVFHDFPFNDGDEGPGNGSRAHLLAMMLQPLVRDMIQGSTPHYLVNKPSPATGASLMISNAMRISVGQEPGTKSLPHNEDELKKTITAALMDDERVIFYDNVNVKLESGHIANLATSPVWSDRFLGKSEITSIPNNKLVIFSGNHVQGSGEIMRRFLPIYLDCKDDPRDPTRRFKIKDLKGYVDEHQKTLFGHLLNMVQFWVNAGMPVWSDSQRLASFESYCDVIGGILETCEIEGFLTNLHLVEGEGDRDRQSWTGFLGSLLASPKFTMDRPMTIAEITGFYASMGTDQPLLAVNGGYRVKTGDDEAQIVNSMERCFDKMVGQIFRVWWTTAGVEEETKVTIKRSLDQRSKRTQYVITRVETAAQAA